MRAGKNVLISGNGPKIYYSVDSTHFNFSSVTLPVASIQRIRYFGFLYYITAADPNEILTSSDAVTWTKLCDTPTLFYDLIKISGSTNVWVGAGSEYFYKSIGADPSIWYAIYTGEPNPSVLGFGPSIKYQLGGSGVYHSSTAPYPSTNMVFSISGAAFTTNEFVGGFIFYLNTGILVGYPESQLVFGKITANTADTITIALPLLDVYGGEGTAAIYNGYLVDFAPDLSTPSSVASFNVNKDVFSYSDNDDKRKLYTKVIAKGKDLQGITISVSLSACHAYDNTRQYYNNSTHITLKSEGYIYRNNYALTYRSVTAIASLTESFTTNYAGGFHNTIYMAAGGSSFPNNAEVKFSTVTGTLPSNIVAGTTYYVRDNGVHGANTFNISAARDGAAMDIGSDAAGTVYVTELGGLVLNNTDGFIVSGSTVYVFAATMPGNLTAGTLYTATVGTESNAWIQLNVAIGPGTGTSVVVVRSTDLINTELGTTPTVWLYGWGYSIPSGSTMAFSIPGVSATGATTTGATTEGTDGNGVQYTAVSLTSMPFADFSGKGYLLNKRLYVEDYSVVGNNEVLIGEEKITIASSGNDTTYGNYIQFASVTARVTSPTVKCYPHGIGALVARTNYTETSPESGSPVDQYGLHIDSETVDGNITYGDLEVYATNLIVGFGNFYRKATCWAPLSNLGVKRVAQNTLSTNRSTPPVLGDTIDIVPFSGDTPIPYEIVMITIKYDEGRISLELGDYEKNVFTSLEQKTNALNRTLT